MTLDFKKARSSGQGKSVEVQLEPLSKNVGHEAVLGNMAAKMGIKEAKFILLGAGKERALGHFVLPSNSQLRQIRHPTLV